MRSLCVALSLLFIGSCVCQVPRPCANSEGLRTKECCPVWKGDGSACGELSGRGSCEDVTVTNEPDGHGGDYHDKDDRGKWPLKFFNRTCHCVRNYSGFDCGACLYGYSGPDCSQYREMLRQNIMMLSVPEQQKFISYLVLAKKTINPDYVIITATRMEMGDNGKNPKFSEINTYDLFTWLHYYATRDTLRGKNKDPWVDIDFAHESFGFGPWHRHFLLFVENEIRKLTKDFYFTIPYWDWRDETECDVCTDALMGGRNALNHNLISPDSVFSSWQVICTHLKEYDKRGVLCNTTGEGPLLRNPGNPGNSYRLPTSADVEDTLKFPEYDTKPMTKYANYSFRNALEGFIDPHTGLNLDGGHYMHNVVHMYMNGTMSDVPGSSNDPVFFVHHAYVDSILERWLRTHPGSHYPKANASIGHNFGYHIVPFLPLHRNGDYFLPTKQLGYMYDYLPDVILERPALVMEGGDVMLRCLSKNMTTNKTSSNLQADFYRNGSLMRTESTGQMTIHNVSKSDEGFYKCNIAGLGESPESLINVRDPTLSSQPPHVYPLVGVGVSILLLILAVVLWKKRRDILGKLC